VKPDVSLAILPFRNASGDGSLAWLGPSLADMLSTDVGQSAHVRTVSPDRLHQVLSDLKVAPDGTLDPTTLRRIAEFSNADTLVFGQFARFGDQVRIDATVRDLKHDRSVALKTESASVQSIPGAVDRLAEAVRHNLSVSSDVVAELRASSFQPSSKSMEALRDYNQALQVLRSGNNLEALKRFTSATQEDAAFALAFAKLGQTYANLGYDNEAEQAARKAVELSEGLPPAEKYLIVANQYRISKDYPKAIAAYQELDKVSPDNPDIESALAGIYENSGDFSKARELYQKLLAGNPKDIAILLAMGRVEILSGNPQASLDPLNRALSLAIQVENLEQKASILHVLGAAYSDLDKPNDALQNYQQSLQIRQQLGEKKGIADSLNMIASTYDGLGKSDLALKNYNAALALYREIDDKQDTGAVLLNLGQFNNDRGRYEEALQLLKDSLQIQRNLHNPNNEALCLNNIGNTYFFKGDYDNARIYFEQALQLREQINNPGDIALTVHNIAEVSTKSGQYEAALAQYMRALELYRKAGDKHGTAMEAYGMGTIFEYQGRFGSAVSAKKEALQDFQAAQEHSFWMAEALGGYGNALSEAGRFEDGAKQLEDGRKQAEALKNNTEIAQVLNWQGDNFLYQADLKAARPLYERALQLASRSSDRNLVLTAKLGSAKAEIAAGQAPSALNQLKGVAEEANSLGSRYLAIESSVYEAEARMMLHDYSRARPQLERALIQSENLGLRPLLLRAHFLLGETLAQQRNIGEATAQFRQVLTLLGEMGKDGGADKIMERADFKLMYENSSTWVRQHS
ncbi:MAG TPA: tetratricopeptide repeat protein, partial [Terriglobales bacterium]|nr:tetratricopeptide repeat protein [Terriglobales bacterium]